MKKIISISGLISSGKDTIADILVNDYGYRKLSFGKALKDTVSAIFGWDRVLLDGASAESRAWREEVDTWWTSKLDFGVTITPRWILQHIGTEVMRQRFHPDIWSLAVEKELVQTTHPLVFTDARFFNELALLKSHNALMVGVHRKLPSHLDKFYEAVNTDLINMGYSPLMSMHLHGTDKGVKTNQKVLSGLGAKHCPLLGGHIKHQSEWEHLLWNAYAKTISNSGSLQDLREQAIALPF